jgi:hypothetical protein
MQPALDGTEVAQFPEPKVWPTWKPFTRGKYALAYDPRATMTTATQSTGGQTTTQGTQPAETTTPSRPSQAPAPPPETTTTPVPPEPTPTETTPPREPTSTPHGPAGPSG